MAVRKSLSPNLTGLLSPISSLLSPKYAFFWGPSQQEAFDNILKELTCPRILTTYDPGKPLLLETDAAQSRCLGMAVWQQDGDGQWRLLQCASRHVTDIEARYSATEIELLAVVWAVHKARLFLAGADFQLIVDSRPLIPIINSKSLYELSTPRIIRMREKLASFRMTAVWRAGIAHKVVDCLSRSPVDQPTTEDELQRSAVLFAEVKNSAAFEFSQFTQVHSRRMRGGDQRGGPVDVDATSSRRRRRVGQARAGVCQRRQADASLKFWSWYRCSTTSHSNLACETFRARSYRLWAASVMPHGLPKLGLSRLERCLAFWVPLASNNLPTCKEAAHCRESNSQRSASIWSGSFRF